MSIAPSITPSPELQFSTPSSTGTDGLADNNDQGAAFSKAFGEQRSTDEDLLKPAALQQAELQIAEQSGVDTTPDVVGLQILQQFDALQTELSFHSGDAALVGDANPDLFRQTADGVGKLNENATAGANADEIQAFQELEKLIAATAPLNDVNNDGALVLPGAFAESRFVQSADDFRITVDDRFSAQSSTKLPFEGGTSISAAAKQPFAGAIDLTAAGFQTDTDDIDLSSIDLPTIEDLTAGNSGASTLNQQATNTLLETSLATVGLGDDFSKALENSISSSTDLSSFGAAVGNELFQGQIDQGRGAPALASPQFQSLAQTAATQIVATMQTNPGQDEVSVQLDPPELGVLQIKFVFGEAGSLLAQLSAENEATRSLLKHHEAELRAALNDAGFADVEMDFSDQSSGDTPREDSESFSLTNDKVETLTIRRDLDNARLAPRQWGNIDNTGVDIRV